MQIQTSPKTGSNSRDPPAPYTPMRDAGTGAQPVCSPPTIASGTPAPLFPSSSLIL
jgi:hypothetical protein